MLRQGKSRHSQISDWLKDEIKKGTYPLNERLPSENELAAHFQVSRVTVRRALQTLENEEVIYRCQGLGSFVNDKRSAQSLVRLTDFDEDMKKAGLQASSEVIRQETEPVPDIVAGYLNLEPGKQVLRIDRLRMGNGESIAFDITWLPLFYGQFIEGYNLTDQTLYQILEQEFDIPIIKGCYRIQAELADEYLSRHLKIQVNTPLLLIDRQSFTHNNKPVYYQKRYYRSDQVVYEMLLERGTESSEPNKGSGVKGGLPLREFSPVFKTES